MIDKPPLKTLWQCWQILQHGGYAVHAQVYEHYLKVQVYEYYLYQSPEETLWDGHGDVPIGKPPGGYAFNRKESGHSPDAVYDASEAQVFLEGSIKWDGCANLTFEEQNLLGPGSCCLHFCGREEAVAVGTLLGKLYDLAKEMIPSWDGD